jgi:hypothetical protein
LFRKITGGGLLLSTASAMLLAPEGASMLMDLGGDAHEAKSPTVITARMR